MGLKRKFNFWLVASLLVVSSNVWGNYSELISLYVDAIRAQNDTALSLGILDQVNGDSGYFPWALFERAQVLYRAKQWESFFGVTLFSRKHIANNPYKEKLLLLETLALLRHCQWDKAKDLLRNNPCSDPNINTLAKLLDINPILGQKEKDPKKQKDTLRRNYWPIPVKVKVNPSKLRRVIRSACELKGDG